MELNIETDPFEIDEQPFTVRRCWSWVHENYFSVAAIKRRFPITRWLPGYEFDELKGDVIAGLSVACTLIPQALGLALLANLPITYGLYSCIFGAFVYSIFGSCKDCNIGPTAIQAIFTGYYVAIGDVHFSALLSFIAGVLQIIVGLLSLDFLVDFVSFPIISAFVNAACITVILSQLPGFFGLPKFANRPPNALMTLVDLVEHLGELSALDTLLGSICVIFIMTLKFTGDYAKTWEDKVETIEEEPTEEEQERHYIIRKLQKVKKIKQIKQVGFFKGLVIWVSLARNLIIVIICAGVAYGLRDSAPFKLTESVVPGLPPFRAPHFSADFNTTVGGKVIHYIENFGELIHTLTPGWFIMPFLSALGAVSIPKAISQSTQNPVPQRLLRNTIPVKNFDPSQEILTLGIANILGSFVNSFPVAVSFSRAMISHTSGAKTQFNTIITGIVVLVALAPSISAAFHYIPVTTLSSVIICAIILIAKPKDIVIVYRTSFVDFVLYLIAFILTIVAGLAAGVLTGIGLSIVVLLAKAARPRIYSQFMHTPIEEGKQQFGFPYVIVKPTQSIHFPAVDYLQTMAIQSFPTLSELENPNIAAEDESLKNDTKLVVVIDGEHLFHTDSTFTKSLKDFILVLKPKGIKVVFHRFRYPIRKPLQVTLAENSVIFNHTKTDDELALAINAAFGFPAPLLGRHSSFTQTSL
ncbi:sodium-independent sulfate anion transporter-like protein [Leptotrombidium deliense]|uniref:Sodium-independent sulfate anion transporter-like protein n=1 Tax=Leptotrombidium deliense TaxID=299467 RepID=A0A443SJS1_9ACAR|nr:sodium-independent sulfate anion transporter-like protein [Leptotrombidium deliense]